MKKSLVLILSLLAVYSHAGPFDEVTTHYGTSSGTPGIYINRARGHSGGPELLGAGDTLSGFYLGGYNGSGFTSTHRASIVFQANQTWSTTANGTKVIIQATVNDTTTLVDALSITGSSVTINTSLFSLPVSTGPRTNVTPTAAGQIIYNSTGKEVCYSSGTTMTTWMLDSTTACSH